MSVYFHDDANGNRLALTANLPVVTVGMAATFWLRMKRFPGHDQNLFTMRDTAFNSYFLGFISNTNRYMRFEAGTVAAGSTSIVDMTNIRPGEWYFVAMIFLAGSPNIFRVSMFDQGGRSRGVGDAIGITRTGTFTIDAVYVGGDPGVTAATFSGHMHDVRLYEGTTIGATNTECGLFARRVHGDRSGRVIGGLQSRIAAPGAYYSHNIASSTPRWAASGKVSGGWDEPLTPYSYARAAFDISTPGYVPGLGIWRRATIPTFIGGR